MTDEEQAYNLAIQYPAAAARALIDRRKSSITDKHIFEAAAIQFDVSVADVKGKASGNRELASARRMCIFGLSRIQGMTQYRIAKLMGYADHTTARYYMKQEGVEAYESQWREFQAILAAHVS